MDNVLQLLKDWSTLDGDIVATDEAWDTKDGCPKLTPEQHRRWIELGIRRNAIVASLERALAGPAI